VKEMRQCVVVRLLRSLSGIRALRPYILKLALRIEGGPFYSLTARWILSTYYGVLVGDYSYGECFVPGTFPPGVKIGRYASIGPDVRVFLRNHPLDRLSTHPFFYNRTTGFVAENNIDTGTLEIGHDAWIGAGVVILRGCSKIGVGAVVGAGSIVTKDIPDFTVAVGNPARVIRMRFSPETCRLILASRWWEKPVSVCIEHLNEMTKSLNDTLPCHPLLVCHGGGYDPDRRRSSVTNGAVTD
jgi:acetyltransferase-like isoleucine patch superfamily enzyme